MKGEELTKKEIKVLRFLRNQLIQYGKSPSIREIMEHLGYQSPRAAAYILEKLKAKGFVDRGKRGRLQIKRDIPNSDMHAQTIEVPLVGSAPCGTPAFAEDNIEAWISVSDKLAKRPHRYFLLRASRAPYEIGFRGNECGCRSLSDAGSEPAFEMRWGF